MTEPGDARKIMQGCDLTADCPAAEHAADCWRGYWLDRDQGGNTMNTNDTDGSGA